MKSFRCTTEFWKSRTSPRVHQECLSHADQASLKADGLTDAHVPISFTVTAIRRRGNRSCSNSGTGAQLQPTSGLITKNTLLENRWHRPCQGDQQSHHRSPPRPHHRPDGQGHQRPNLPQRPNPRAGRGVQILDQIGDDRGVAKRIQAVFRLENIRQFEGDKEVVPGVRPVATPGHTPGHTSYQMASGNRQLIVLGDVTNIRALNLRNPGWHIALTADPAMAEANRRKIFDRGYRRQGHADRGSLGRAGCRDHQEGWQRLRFCSRQGIRFSHPALKGCSEPRRRSRRKALRRRAAPFRWRLVVMVKVPVAGRVKTRLAAEMGVAIAARFTRHRRIGAGCSAWGRDARWADHDSPLRPTAVRAARSGRAG